MDGEPNSLKKAKPRWHSKRTSESRKVEEALRPYFHQVDSYRYNSASLRLRVIDPRFEGKSMAKRDAMVEVHIKRLPEELQREIVALYSLAPSELSDSLFQREFEKPSRSML